MRTIKRNGEGGGGTEKCHFRLLALGNASPLAEGSVYGSGALLEEPPFKAPSVRSVRILEELDQEQLRSFVFYMGNFNSQFYSHSYSGRIPREELSGATHVQEAELDVTTAVGPRFTLPGPFDELREERWAATAVGPRFTLPGPFDELREERWAAVCDELRTRAPKAGQPRQVSDKELMKLAKNMGKNWKQIAIEYLGMKMSHLEQVEEENPNNVVMRAFYVLLDWRKHEGERATAAQLYVVLNQKGVPLDREAYGFLLENA